MEKGVRRRLVEEMEMMAVRRSEGGGGLRKKSGHAHRKK